MADPNRPGLSRQKIIGTALRLLDEVGLDGLTVRRLAAELGVKSPALYWHFRNKQELLDAMADEITQAAGMGPPYEGESWRDWLTRRTRAYRRSLLVHRDGARLVTSAARLSMSTVKTFDEELSAMVALGFTPVLALRTITALAHYAIGAVLQEQTARQEPARDAQARLGELVEALDGGASATLLVAYRQSGGLGEETFEHGLRMLIDGTAAALAETVARQG